MLCGPWQSRLFMVIEINAKPSLIILSLLAFVLPILPSASQQTRLETSRRSLIKMMTTGQGSVTCFTGPVKRARSWALSHTHTHSHSYTHTQAPVLLGSSLQKTENFRRIGLPTCTSTISCKTTAGSMRLCVK